MSNSPDILALCETNLNDSVDSGSFYVRGYHPLISKDSITDIHGHVKGGCLFTQDLSFRNLGFLCKFSTGFTSFKVLVLFSCIDHRVLCAQFLMLFHLT